MNTESVFTWMTPDPVTVSPGTSLIDASQLMRERSIRRLPVISQSGQLVGIVTLGDVREAAPSEATTLSVWELNYQLAKLRISEIMTRDPITVRFDDTLVQAATLMLDNKISGLPVLDDRGRLVGIITESDIFRMVVFHWGQTEPQAALAGTGQ